MKRAKHITSLILIVLALLALSASVTFAQGPLGTKFTYQGRLTDGGAAPTGAYDFEFRLFNTPAAGTQIGSPYTRNDVTVTNGLFVVELDFGAGAFDGQQRYLEVGVRPGPSTGAYTTLSPRQ